MAATFSITLDKKLVVAKTKTTEDEERRPKTRKRRPSPPFFSYFILFGLQFADDLTLLYIF